MVFHSSGVDPYIRSSDLIVNEQDSTTSEQSRSLRRTRSLSALLPARLTSSQRVETTLEQRNDDSFTHDVPIVTSPRTNSCLSPIGHLSFPESFNDFAGSTPTVGSPQKQSRSIEHVIRRNYQDVEGELSPDRLTFVSALFLNRSSLNCLVGMPSRPVQSGYLLR